MVLRMLPRVGARGTACADSSGAYRRGAQVAVEPKATRIRRSVVGHFGAVRALACSSATAAAGARCLASAAADRTVLLWPAAPEGNVRAMTAGACIDVPSLLHRSLSYASGSTAGLYVRATSHARTTHTGVPTRTHTRARAYTHTHTHRRARTHSHSNSGTGVHTHARMHTRTCTQTHARARTHTKEAAVGA